MKKLFTTFAALILLVSFAFAGGGDKACATKTKTASCCATKSAKTTHSCDPLEGKCSDHPGMTKEMGKSDQQDSKTNKKAQNTSSPI